MSNLGAAGNGDGPGGVALIDHDTFEVTGAWETDRGDQYFAYDVWWHLNEDVAVTSEWATPSMIEDGLNPEDLLGKRFGHHLDFWSLSEGRLLQRVDLGDEHQMVLEVRPAHDPRKTWGFVGVVISVEDLSASVWLWHRDGDHWAVEKAITIPAEPAEADQLPPALQPFGAVPPLVSDIDLSVDDRWLYVSCWGTGELKQYDVSDPAQPDRDRLGPARRDRRPQRPTPPLPSCRWPAAPQMVEISRDGRRVYFTNSLYASWDDVFYPDGVGAWMARVDADVEQGGMSVDPQFFPHGDDFRGLARAPDATPGRRRVQRLVLLRRVAGWLAEVARAVRPAVAHLLGVPLEELLPGCSASAPWWWLTCGCAKSHGESHAGELRRRRDEGRIADGGLITPRLPAQVPAPLAPGFEPRSGVWYPPWVVRNSVTSGQ